MQEDTSIIEFTTAHEALISAGKFKDILEAAQSKFGCYSQWQHPKLIKLAYRCLTHLGLGRKADAMLLWAWRKHPHHPALATSYVNVIRNRRGVLQAWLLSKQLMDSPLEDQERADLLVEQAYILSVFRDFSLADEKIRQARSLSKELWVTHSEAFLLYTQDRYTESKQKLTDLLADQPNYRPSLQLLAHILLLENQAPAALRYLQGIADTAQSTSLIQQLVYLAIEIKDYPLADQYFALLENTFYAKPDYVIRQLNYIKADLLCAQQLYEQALPYFEQKNLYFSKIAQAIENSKEDARRCVLDVPFIRQHHMTCSPASITAVSMYWGVEIEQQQVVAEICYNGTPNVDERDWIERQGWLAIEFDLQYGTLKKLIDAGFPVLLATVEPGSAHLQVIVGYDEQLGVYILRDPYNPRLQELLVEESHRYYASSGPRCLLMAPKSAQHKIADCKFSASSLYTANYHLTKALDNNNRKLAYQAYREMLSIDEQHRLTLYANRKLAVYDNNEPLILKLTEQLLQRYPDDVNLQLSKIASMAYMGSYNGALAYLEALCEKPHAHYLLKSRLARDLSNDQRQQDRAEKLLQDLLRIQSADVSVLKVYADLLWSKCEYKLSYEIYRFITCMEDKVEEYASNYFKAARYFKEAEQALQFLIDRFERFTTHSSGPVISLFNALDSIDRTAEGLTYLEKAITMRPKDGALIAFASRQYCLVSDIKRGEQLLHEANPLVNHLQYAKLAAEIHELQNRKREALEHWRTILAYEPLDHTANYSLVRLLSELGDEASARQHISDQLAKYPGNYVLLRLQVNWCDEQDLPKIEAAYRELIEHHADDQWAYKGLARHFIQQTRYQDALHWATLACQICSNDPDVFCCLGEVYEGMAEYPNAVAQLRAAIKISCDATQAFQALLQCVPQQQDKRDQLQFIKEQLMDQVSFGDGILEFQRISRSWYSSEELIQFLDFAIQERPDLWQSWVALATEKRELEEFDQAHGVIDTAIERFPMLPRLYYEKAEIYFYQHKLADAEQQLRIALNYSPNWHLAANRLSEVLEYQHKQSAAIEVLQEVIRKSPFTVSPYGYLADLYWRVGNKQEAFNTLLSVLDFSPLYNWAWQRLCAFSRELDRQAEVISRIEQVRAKMPDHADLLSMHVNLIDDPEQKNEILQSFLSRHPTTIDACLDYIDNLMDLQRFDQALDLCGDQRWGDIVPIRILDKKGQVLYRIGEVNEAIKTVQLAVERDPNFYNGWRQLANWHDERSESEQVIECANQCKRIFPNDAGVVCFVAELWMTHAPEQQQQASKLLERAFHLDPTNRYIGLTYFDDLISQGAIETATQMLETLQRHVRDDYVTSRELALACKLSNSARVSELWGQLILSPQLEEGLASYCWDLLDDADYLAEGSKIIEQQRSRDTEQEQHNLNPHVGKYWTQYLAKSIGVKKCLKNLLKTEVRDAFFDRCCEGLCHALINDNAPAPKPMIEQLRERLMQDSKNWGLVGYLYALQGDWQATVDWMQDALHKANTEAWMIYFYSVALREIGQWTQGVAATQHALRMERDHYFEDLIVWSEFDRLLALEGPVSENSLYDYVTRDNLSNLSQYIFSLVECLMCLNGRTFTEAHQELSPVLRLSQKDFQSVKGHQAANIARMKLRHKLQGTLTGNFMKKSYWKWLLSNHF